MKHNENLDMLEKKLLNDEDILNEFCSLDSLDEIYEFCLSIQDGYDKEEFALFIDEILSSIDTLELNEVTENNLKLIAAGKNNIDAKKILATSLASLSFIATPIAHATSSTKVDTSVNTKVSKSTNDKESSNESPNKKVSFWDKVKQKVVQIKDWLVDNKGKVTIGVLLAALLMYNKTNIEDAIKEKKAKNQELKRLNEKMRTAINKYNNATTDSEKESYYTEYHNLQSRLQTVQNNKTAADKYFTFAGLLSFGGSILGGFNQINRTIKNYRDAQNAIDDLQERLAEHFALQQEIKNKKPYNANDARKQLEKDLKEQVKGQQDAKKQALTFFGKVNLGKDMAKKENKKLPTYVMVLNGPSGVGKSHMAQYIAKSLSNSKPLILNNGMVDLKSSRTIPEQLFIGQSSYGYGWGDYYQNNDKTSLVQYVKDHKNDGVVIIEEYDKFIKKGSTETHPLDPILQSFMDGDHVGQVGNHKIDCSGITFILTTNETNSSLDHELQVGINSDGEKYLIDNDPNSKIYQNRIRHETHFLNRVKNESGVVAHFESLKFEDCKEVTKYLFTPKLNILKEGFNEDDKRHYDIEIPETSYDAMANCMLTKDEGARVANSFFDSLLIELTTVTEGFDDKYNNSSFEATFDPKTETFSLKITGKTSK